MNENLSPRQSHSEPTVVDLTARLSLTALYEQVEDGWTQARIRELPAVITAAPTLEEAKELLVDALREYLLSLEGDVGGDDLEGKRGKVEIVIRAA